MPSRRLPNSVPAVIRALKAAHDAWKITINPADRAITAAQWSKLDESDPGSVLSRLLKEASEVDLAQAAQAPLTSELAKLAGRLTQFISHFHQVLDLGIARGAFSAGARSYYGRDINATTIPALGDYQTVADAAERIVSGETARKTAEGAAYVPMALPSAVEVGALGTQFSAVRALSQTAQATTDRQRDELSAVYAEAQVLAVDICETVEFFYRKEPESATRRAKCQRWGLVFLYEGAQTAEPQPTPPTPAPAPAQ